MKTIAFVLPENSKPLPLTFKEISPKRKNKNPKFFLIFALIVLVFTYTLSHTREQKKAKEIERIKSKKNLDKYPCEQYALVAMVNGWYPCFNCYGDKTIFLYKNEVWKYGKTLFPNTRYTGLFALNLFYEKQFVGTEQECLIIEKEKIYNYPNLPENLKREKPLLRPPGNKIDR